MQSILAVHILPCPVPLKPCHVVAQVLGVSCPRSCFLQLDSSTPTRFRARVGQKVKKGQAIGTVGSTGGSIAPHLHYEVIVDSVNVDPIKYFIEQLSADQFKELVIRSKKMNQSLD